MESSNRRLMWHGMFLFLMGLLTGFASSISRNVRMALAAHLERVMNGTFPPSLGCLDEVRLPAVSKAITYWIALYATYGNWLITQPGCGFWDGGPLPITGAGHSGSPWQESFVTFGFLSVGITIIATSIFVLWGLRAKAAA